MKKMMAMLCMVAVLAGLFCGCKGNGALEQVTPSRPYIAAVSIDDKLGVIFGEELVMTDYDCSYDPTLSFSLDGSAAVCNANGRLLYLKDGKVHEIVKKYYNYVFCASGNAVAFQISSMEAAEAGLEKGLYLYDVATGKTEYVGAQGDYGSQDYTLSPDGKTLAYIYREGGKCNNLMIYQNGVSTTRMETTWMNRFHIISIDNSAEVIYLRGTSQELLYVNGKGEQVKLAQMDRKMEYEYYPGDMHVIYSNADHTQLMYVADGNTYLSDRGQEGVPLGERVNMHPVQPALAVFQYGKNTVTCCFETLGTQLMSTNNQRQFFLRDESGKYSVTVEIKCNSRDCWLDPTGRYLFVKNWEQQLLLLDAQGSGEPVVLVEKVAGYAVSDDCSILYYYDDLPFYGGSLYKADALDPADPQKLEADYNGTMAFSENNGLYFLTGEEGDVDLYTFKAKGEAELLLENVEQFEKTQCGLIFLHAGENHYIIRGGKLIQLNRNTEA